MTSATQIPFRYRESDSQSGVSRATARRLMEAMGLDETAVIHMALHDLAVKMLPQYEADPGPLTAAQLKRIRALVPQERDRHIASSLFPMTKAPAARKKSAPRAKS